MIRGLIELMFVKHLSIEGIAKTTGQDVQDVQNRVDMLIHMGYVKKVRLNSADCGGSCLGCSLMKKSDDNCSEDIQPPSKDDGMWGYELTEKGSKLVESSGSS